MTTPPKILEDSGIEMDSVTTTHSCTETVHTYALSPSPFLSCVKVVTICHGAGTGGCYGRGLYQNKALFTTCSVSVVGGALGKNISKVRVATNDSLTLCFEVN